MAGVQLTLLEVYCTGVLTLSAGGGIPASASLLKNNSRMQSLFSCLSWYYRPMQGPPRCFSKRYFLIIALWGRGINPQGQAAPVYRAYALSNLLVGDNYWYGVIAVWQVIHSFQF